MESQRINRALSGAILPCLIILLSGCIGHHFFYKFNLDGDCEFSYRARGDSLDIYQPEGSFPTEPFFDVDSWTEVDSAGTETHVLEARTRLRSDSLPRTLGLKEVPWAEVFLKHPARMKRTPLLFLSIYKFEGAFKGRDRTAIEGDPWKYIPEECRILESEEDTTLGEEERGVLEEKYAAGMLIWNAERYKLRIREILDRVLAFRPEVSVPRGWIDSALVETDSLIDAYLADIHVEELDLANLEWWDDLAPGANQILFENLNLIGDSVLQAEIGHVGELLEMQHQVSEDLMDESFEVRVDLPGRVLSYNAPAMDEGVLVWKFDGENLANDDFQMSALSLYIFASRVVGALVLIIAIYLGIKFKRPTAKEESPEPPPSHDAIPPTGHG